MHITFTPAAETDLPELLALARAAAQAPGSHWDETYPDADILLGDIARQSLYRIQLDGAFGGMIAMGRLEEMQDLSWPTADENACELSRLGLHPDCQGKGLLGPTLSQAVAYCRTLGYCTFRLLVSTDFQRIIQVYERCGFTRVGQVHLWDQDFFQYEQSFPTRPTP